MMAEICRRHKIDFHVYLFSVERGRRFIEWSIAIFMKWRIKASLIVLMQIFKAKKSEIIKRSRCFNEVLESLVYPGAKRCQFWVFSYFIMNREHKKVSEKKKWRVAVPLVFTRRVITKGTENIYIMLPEI